VASESRRPRRAWPMPISTRRLRSEPGAAASYRQRLGEQKAAHRLHSATSLQRGVSMFERRLLLVRGCGLESPLHAPRLRRGAVVNEPPALYRRLSIAVSENCVHNRPRLVDCAIRKF
jgi:hypothetical protein